MDTPHRPTHPTPTHPWTVLDRLGLNPVASGSTTLSPAAAASSLAPTGAFVAVDQWLGLVPAMITASLVTVLSIILRRRRGNGIGLILPISLCYVVVKAIAGVLTGSQLIYFGAGLALSALLSLAIAATAFTRQPAASYLLPLVTPYRHLSPHHPIHRRVSAQVTAAWALAELGITSWEAWHLTASSASEFVVTRTIVAWPVMGTVIFLLIAYVRFRLDRYEYLLDRTVATLIPQDAA